MEAVIRHVVVEKILDSSFFSDYQYGFIKGRSTVLQLLKTMDEWTYNLDQRIQIPDRCY